MTALGFEALKNLIDDLPDGEKRLICFRWADGLSDLEIASLTDSDPVHVTTRLAALEQVLFERLIDLPEFGQESMAAA